ncbi:MAG: helix-turn-helix domain-containing protein [Stomatobaculum sp.]|nr:helix-turn-helix domain-containing protein [Stomatobaculum sp.]
MALPVRNQLAQQIVDAIRSICDYDINFIDTDGHILVSTDASRVGDFHETARRAAALGTAEIVTEDDPVTGTRRGINQPIRYKGETVAVIGITGDPEEVVRYARLAQRITVLLLREHEVEVEDHIRRTQVNHVIRAMINNETPDREYLEEVLKRYGITEPGGMYTTLLIHLNPRIQPDLLSGIEEDIYRIFRQLQPCLYTFNYPDEYILIAGSARLRKQMYLFEQLLQNRRGLLKIAAGESCRLVRQQRSYDSARLVLQSMRAEGNIVRYEDLDLELLMISVPPLVRDAYLRKVTEHLDQKDRELLKVYFECDLSLKETAEKLFLHKNTLQYRLKRIADLTGYDPRQFRSAEALHMGLMLEEVRDHRENRKDP